MAAPKLGFFEKIANLTGALYRHQHAQFPRRFAILKVQFFVSVYLCLWTPSNVGNLKNQTLQAVGKHELAPPRQADWPAIKADWAKVQSFIQTGGYKNLSIRVSFC